MWRKKRARDLPPRPSRTSSRPRALRLQRHRPPNQQAMPPPRAPLSTLSLTPYISLNTRRSPQKSRMASPLRTSSSSRRSTTPRHATAGPLGTLYEAPPLAPSILAVQASPARRMLEADEREVDEEDGLGATPPRRLLDMFLQSATKPVNGSSERSSRSSSPAFGGASASLTVEREELPGELCSVVDCG